MNGVEQMRVTSSLVVPPAGLSNNLLLMATNGRQQIIESLVGYIDELRISSTARYSGASFTPPAAAFTPDSNTVFLHHFNGTNGSTAWAISGQDTTLASDSANEVHTSNLVARNAFLAGSTITGTANINQLVTNQTIELIVDTLVSGSTINQIYTHGAIYSISAASSNMTLSLTNVPTTGAWRSINITAIIGTSSNKTYINALNINGSAVTLAYQGGASGTSVSSSATYAIQTINVIYLSSATTPTIAFTSVSSMW
jgi:hypothetical protein